jgi:general secretion pathway protein D
VTFISAKPLNHDELYQAFLSALQVNNSVALPDGAVIKVVPDYVAKGLSSPIYNEMMRKESDAMAVSVVAIKYVPVNELAAALNQFLTPAGHIASYSPSNDLIVADRAGNITHLMHLINQIDQQRASKIEVIHLHNAQAKTLVETLKSISGQKPGGGVVSTALEPSLAADDRTNTILISGGSQEQRLQIRAVIANLDMSSSMPGSVTEVIYLKHLHAERAATIVNALIMNYIGKGGAGLGTPSQSGQSSSASSGDNSASNLFNGSLGQGGQNSSSTSTMYSAQGGYFTSNGQNNDISSIISKSPKSGSVSPAVQWEESTNSLIVTAPRDLMRKVTHVINKIDIRRPQVLIEAVIAEVSTSREKELGITFNPGGRVQFLTNFTPLLPLSTIGPDGKLASAGAADTPGQGLSVTYNGNQIRMLIAALETDTESNVLATPNLVTLDNEPAQIKVGSKISFATAQIQNNPTGGNPFNFFDREDVGLVLTIDPQITPNGSIKLLIQQELSAIIPNSATAGGNPNTTERFIRTTVMADDGQILVLGGLLQNQREDVSSKIPILGNIPGLGLLMKDHARTSAKTNLMIFLRPTILYSDKDDLRVSGGKYEFLRQSQLQTERDSPSKYSYEIPVLPVEGKDVVLPVPFPSAMRGQG